LLPWPFYWTAPEKKLKSRGIDGCTEQAWQTLRTARVVDIRTAAGWYRRQQAL
jgi:hypothetical protein